MQRFSRGNDVKLNYHGPTTEDIITLSKQACDVVDTCKFQHNFLKRSFQRQSICIFFLFWNS